MKIKKVLIKIIFKHRFKKAHIIYGKNCSIGKDVVNLWGRAKIIIGDNVIIHSGVTFGGDGIIEIANNTSIGANTWMYVSKEAGIKIGSFTTFGPFCFLIDSDHGIEKDIPIEKQKKTFGKICIGDDCWIGTNVTILKNTILKNHCVAGAKALLNKDYPENSIIGGVPGKVIKSRQ